MLRLGMLTPSSNTILEPATARILESVEDISVHVSRFRVTHIGLDEAALGQFDETPILAAADLLADAKVDVIAWNGTSASWLGLERDRILVRALEARTGIPAATCMLGFFDLFERRAVKTIGLVTPYTSDVQARIAERYSDESVVVIEERHLGLRDNFSFATVSPATIQDMVTQVAAAGPDAVAIVCTNMNGFRVAAEAETALGVPVFDSVAVCLRACLLKVGASLAPLRRWGSVFAD
jgi:maleate isomerase